MATKVVELTDKGIIPVFNHTDTEVCKQVLKACFDGGLRVFEFTNRSENAYEVFIELRKFSASHYPEMSLGIGSITDGYAVKRYIYAGADFIVSPIVSKEIVKECSKRRVPWISGCATPSEMVYAYKLGAKIIKMFPAEFLGGPAFVKAVKAPMPWLNIMPTGGVDITEENLKQWFEAGVCCVGLGSKLFSKQIIESGDFAKLTEIIRKTIEIISKYKT